MSAFTWCSGMGIGGWLVMIALWGAFLVFAVWAITRIFPVSAGSGPADTRPNQTADIPANAPSRVAAARILDGDAPASVVSKATLHR